MSNQRPTLKVQHTEFMPNDPLRRDYVMACLDDVQLLAEEAYHAILVGKDALFETQVDLIRLMMREAIHTYRMMQKEGKR